MTEKTKRKPKSSQLPFALALVIALVVFGNWLFGINPTLAIALAFGIAFGYVLQRSRFCFTAAFRDPWLTGSTSLARAVVVAIALATVGFTLIKYKAFLGEQTIPGMHSVGAIGIPLVLGGIMFGVGMVIAGGCASGTLMRVGEGFQMQIISLFFFMVGSLWGVHDLPFWNTLNTNAPKIFLPDVFGWGLAFVIQMLALFAVYLIAYYWQKKRMGEVE